jgi:hypothetical protein
MMRVNPSDKADGARKRAQQKGVAMGQAAVDLPDPLEKPKPAPIGSADELLAQLAGDEIDRLLADGDAGNTPAPVAPAPIPQAAAPIAPAPIEPPVHHEEQETAPAERSALHDHAIARKPAHVLNLNSDIPLILKPLVWMNLPLERFPEGVREAMGKIAVMTMVNAIAVLAYVIIFRRHH